MQWSPDGGFSTATELRRPMVEGEYGPERVNVASQRRDPDSLLNWFERLIRRRRECPELGFGTLTLLDTGAPSVLAHRCDWEGATIVAVHELGGQSAEVPLPVVGRRDARRPVRRRGARAAGDARTSSPTPRTGSACGARACGYRRDRPLTRSSWRRSRLVGRALRSTPCGRVIRISAIRRSRSVRLSSVSS